MAFVSSHLFGRAEDREYPHSGDCFPCAFDYLSFTWLQQNPVLVCGEWLWDLRYQLQCYETARKEHWPCSAKETLASVALCSIAPSGKSDPGPSGTVHLRILQCKVRCFNRRIATAPLLHELKWWCPALQLAVWRLYSFKRLPMKAHTRNSSHTFYFWTG